MLKKDDVKVKKRREKLKALKKGWIDNIEETSSQKAYLSVDFKFFMLLYCFSYFLRITF